MNRLVHIIGDSETQLWGLGGADRLRRMLAKRKDVEVVEDIRTLESEQPLLLIRGDYVFDERVLASLLESDNDLVLVTDNGPAAARTTAVRAEELAAALKAGDEAGMADHACYRPADLGSGYHGRLMKNDPVLVLPINERNRDLLETELFAGSYKGVTDLITKWVWPLPARYATRLCVHYGLRPNHVTLAGLVLAVVAGVAFWFGYHGSGLVMAWLMTFLDTVDGKLARVTVSSTRFGDILDHGIDLVHPPLWYWAWGAGLAGLSMPIPGLGQWMWVLLIAYVGGRLCEGAFQLLAGSFSLFIWRPLDSFNRLVTARRNPNLIFLTLSLFAGRPDIGFYSVVLWHVVSTVVLAGRLIFALRERARTGALRSWLADIDPRADRSELAVRLFTRRPAPALVDQRRR